jgi:hypothetical protein
MIRESEDWHHTQEVRVDGMLLGAHVSVAVEASITRPDEVSLSIEGLDALLHAGCNEDNNGVTWEVKNTKAVRVLAECLMQVCRRAEEAGILPNLDPDAN